MAEYSIKDLNYISTKEEIVYLSIIIPVYNVEKYIEKCLKSILEQITHEVEVIIVDDCTPDKSIEKCKKYIDKENNISIIHRKENGGLSAARNTGITNSRGRFCWFVDSDDYISEGAINRILECIKYYENTDLIMFDHERIKENGEVLFKSELTESLIKINSISSKIGVINKYLRNDFGFEVWRKIFSLDIIKEKNIKFEPNAEIFAEDICFFLYYINYCKKIVVKNECNYKYLIRDDSIMGKKKKAKLNEIIKLSSKVYDYNGAANIKRINASILFRLIQIEIGESFSGELDDIVLRPENVERFLRYSKRKFANLFLRTRYYGKKSTVIQIAEIGYIENSISCNALRKKLYYDILKILGGKNEKSTSKN